ncbi:unnamed protein product [Polarella glacialis]|uniref:RNase H type-1 domain-containing protein n=1 Tax=Polarella glacialis TaxID=89957 RepID=A0A813D4S7_POLGL|nr:unnamed protein product [Polarella glacialis]
MPGHGGTAMMAPTTQILIDAVRHDECRHSRLHDTTRWHYVKCPVHDKGLHVHAFSWYGFPGATTCDELAKKNDVYMNSMFECAAEVGDMPVVICMDANMVTERSAAIVGALSTGEWVDLAREFAAAKGQAVTATYDNKADWVNTDIGHGKTRIDVVIVNRIALAAIVGFELKYDWAKKHVPLLVTFDWQRVKRQGPVLTPAVNLDLGSLPEEDELENLGHEWWQRVGHKFDNAEDKTVEDLWEHLNVEVLDFLLQNGAKPVGNKKVKRGVMPSTQMKRIAAMGNARGQAGTSRSLALSQALRRAKELTFRVDRIGSLDGDDLINTSNLFSKLNEFLAMDHECAHLAKDFLWHKCELIQVKELLERLLSQEEQRIAKERALEHTRAEWNKLPELTHGDLCEEARRRRQNAKGGLDMWNTCELQVLPVELFKPWEIICKKVENGCLWPEIIRSAALVVLDKGAGMKPLSKRLITLLSVWYLAWSGLRFRQTMEWQSAVLPPELCGGIAGRGASDAYIPMALKIEAAQYGLGGCAGNQVDKTKCFDRLIPLLACANMHALGLPAGLGRAVASLYVGFKRYVKLGQWVELIALMNENGMAQGDPLTILALSCLVAVWALAVKAVAEVHVSAYLDDTNVVAVASKIEDLRYATAITKCFDEAIGSATNLDKSQSWATDRKLRIEVKDICEDLTLHTKIVSLGADLNTLARRQFGKIKSRIDAAVCFAKLITSLPGAHDEHARVFSTVVVPKVTWACEIAPLPSNAVTVLRSASRKCVWGHGRALRSPHIVLTLLRKGHAVDPGQAHDYRALCGIRQFLQKHHELRDFWATVWEARSPVRHRLVTGPVARISEICRKLGWNWDEPFQIKRPTLPPLHLHQGSDLWWKHQVRDGLRRQQWSAIGLTRKGSGRKDIAFRHPVIDEYASCLLLRNNPVGEHCVWVRRAMEKLDGFTATHRGILESILTGSIRTQSRLFAAGMAESPICLLCGNFEEDVKHMFACEATKHARTRKATDVLFDDTWLQRGILTLEPAADAEQLQLVAMRDDVPGCIKEPGLRRRSCWTDGACENNAFIRYRRAGAGVFYEAGSINNISLPLPGVIQTNQRAELWASVLAVRTSKTPLWIKTDSEWAVMLWSGFILKQTVPDAGVEHADLWNELWALTHAGCDAADRLPWLILSKVKGHADAEDIEQQVITAADKEGNHGADLMATDGAKKHRMSPRVLQRFHKLVKNTMWRQVDLIATVLARNDLIKQAGKWNASQHETCDAFGGDEILFDAARVEERDARQIQNAGTFSDKYPGYGWQYPKVGVAHAVNTKPRFHLTARDWGYSVSFHDLLHRYFNGLKWAMHHEAKVSWIELTIDFIAATGCFPYQPGKGKAKQADKDFLHQVSNFRTAVKRFNKIHACSVWPREAVLEQRIVFFATLGMPAAPGLCNVRPVFRVRLSRFELLDFDRYFARKTCTANADNFNVRVSAASTTTFSPYGFGMNGSGSNDVEHHPLHPANQAAKLARQACARVALRAKSPLACVWASLQVLVGDVAGALRSIIYWFGLWKKHDALPEVFDTRSEAPTTARDSPLRPELIEAVFYLSVAMPGDSLVFQIAKEMATALDSQSRVACGFASVADVTTNPKRLDDRMDSFFLSETLVYLYLTLAPSEELEKVSVQQRCREKPVWSQAKSTALALFGPRPASGCLRTQRWHPMASADGDCPGMGASAPSAAATRRRLPEPAWHRRQRRERSIARFTLRALRMGAVLASHHSSHGASSMPGKAECRASAGTSQEGAAGLTPTTEECLTFALTAIGQCSPTLLSKIMEASAIISAGFATSSNAAPPCRNPCDDDVARAPQDRTADNAGVREVIGGASSFCADATDLLVTMKADTQMILQALADRRVDEAEGVDETEDPALRNQGSNNESQHSACAQVERHSSHGSKNDLVFETEATLNSPPKAAKKARFDDPWKSWRPTT